MKKLTALALTLSAAAALGGPATASAATRHFEGRVVSVNRDAKTFRLNDAERGVKRIKVVSGTNFERVTFSGLRKGMSGIEVTARRSNGRWVAVTVEKSGGGDNHGGDDNGGGRGGRDDRGADDHGRHGNDD